MVSWLQILLFDWVGFTRGQLNSKLLEAKSCKPCSGVPLLFAEVSLRPCSHNVYPGFQGEFPLTWGDCTCFVGEQMMLSHWNPPLSQTLLGLAKEGLVCASGGLDFLLLLVEVVLSRGIFYSEAGHVWEGKETTKFIVLWECSYLCQYSL